MRPNDKTKWRKGRENMENKPTCSAMVNEAVGESCRRECQDRRTALKNPNIFFAQSDLKEDTAFVEVSAIGLFKVGYKLDWSKT